MGSLSALAAKDQLEQEDKQQISRAVEETSGLTLYPSSVFAATGYGWPGTVTSNAGRS